MVYLSTFGSFMGQMLVNIPYMDPMGNMKTCKMTFYHFEIRMLFLSSPFRPVIPLVLQKKTGHDAPCSP